MLKYLPEIGAYHTQILKYLAIFVLGVCVGSWSELWASFIMAEGRPAVKKCLVCGARLRHFSVMPETLRLNIPPKCNVCGTVRPCRHLLAELFAATFCLLLLKRFGASSAFLFSVAALGFWMLHAITDMENGYIYDSAAIAMAVTGLFLRLMRGTPALLDGVGGAVAGCGIILIVVILTRSAMGTGDAMLMLGTGAMLGWRLTLTTLYFGVVIGGIYAIVMLLCKKIKARDTLPLAPFIAAGGLTSIFAGEFIYAFLGQSLIWP